MRTHLLIALIFCGLLVGCKGGEKASETAANGDNNANQVGDPNPTVPNPTPNPTPTPQPQPPVITASPGEIVSASDPDPDPMATYPPSSDPVVFAPSFDAEPNTDYIVPIISITAYPNAYTPNDGGTIQLWAADNNGGSGLKFIECSVDKGAYADCGTQLDLSNLSEGIHLIEARANDWDENQSTVVSYAFYVDQTPPVVMIENKPMPTTTSQDATFQFAAQDEGSGVDRYVCRKNGEILRTCNSTEAYSDLPEGPHSLVVSAVDSVGNVSENASYKWTVDMSPPVISWQTQPNAQIYTGMDAMLNFKVTDTYSPNNIAVVCTLNGVAMACAAGQTYSVPAPVEGNWSFSVTATDEVGNAASSSISWAAVKMAEDRSTSIMVGDDRPVDILFVVDNSGSMDFERSNLAQRIDGMITMIDGLDWQIAVTSTDSQNTDAKSDGRLLELLGLPGEYILDSNMDVTVAQSVFGDTIQNFGNGSGTEEGIYSSKRVIDRFLAGEAPHTDFLRNGADLSIVVLSDEDEASTGGSNVRITPQEFVNFVDTSFNSTKNMVFHSIIAKPGDTDCLNGEGANAGDEYDALSRLTGFGETGGAIIGSVCETDYANQLKDIGQSVKDLQNSIKLQCNPFDADSDGTPDVQVYYRLDSNANYVLYNGTRSFNNDRVIFDDLLPPGDYKVDYQCRIN